MHGHNLHRTCLTPFRGRNLSRSFGAECGLCVSVQIWSDTDWKGQFWTIGPFSLLLERLKCGLLRWQLSTVLFSAPLSFVDDSQDQDVVIFSFHLAGTTFLERWQFKLALLTRTAHRPLTEEGMPATTEQNRRRVSPAWEMDRGERVREWEFRGGGRSWQNLHSSSSADRAHLVTVSFVQASKAKVFQRGIKFSQICHSNQSIMETSCPCGDKKVVFFKTSS